jgi:hypothetical protein
MSIKKVAFPHLPLTPKGHSREAKDKKADFSAFQ